LDALRLEEVPPAQSADVEAVEAVRSLGIPNWRALFRLPFARK
jgi:hypothetical protein